MWRLSAEVTVGRYNDHRLLTPGCFFGVAVFLYSFELALGYFARGLLMIAPRAVGLVVICHTGTPFCWYTPGRCPGVFCVASSG